MVVQEFRGAIQRVEEAERWNAIEEKTRRPTNRGMAFGKIRETNGPTRLRTCRLQRCQIISCIRANGFHPGPVAADTAAGQFNDEQVCRGQG